MCVAEPGVGKKEENEEHGEGLEKDDKRWRMSLCSGMIMELK